MQHIHGKGAMIAPSKRTDLGALPIDCLTLSDAVGRMEAAIGGGAPPVHVVTANMQFLGLARRDPAFAHVVRNAGLVVPDGAPLLWLSRLRNRRGVTRITGHDLVHASAELAAAHGLSVGFLGSGPGIAERAASELTRLYPGLKVAGIFRGSFDANGLGATAQDEKSTVAAIRRARPDILFVALGCPKQEMWIYRHQRTTGVRVAIGVGGVLDVLAGRFKRAPQWMQRSGMEWLYRLAQDPGRLWRRYLAQDLPTLALAVWDTVRERGGWRGLV